MQAGGFPGRVLERMFEKVDLGGFRSRWAPVVEACCRNKKVPGDLSGCCLPGRTLEPFFPLIPL